MSDIVRVKYSIATDRVGSECSEVVEFDRQVWEAMTEDEQNAEMQDLAFNYLDWGWWEVV